MGASYHRHELHQFNPCGSMLFAVSSEENVTTSAGPGLKLKGTSNQAHWDDPKYTKFVEYIGRISFDKSYQSLVSYAFSSKTKDSWLYIFKYNDQFYTLATSGSRGVLAFKKNLEEPGWHGQREGGLTQLVLIPGLPSFLKL
jgi:hypothetical protein